MLTPPRLLGRARRLRWGLRCGWCEVPKITVVSSRRAYVFRPPELRLAALSTQEVRQAIKEAFAFNDVQVTTPPESFGPVPTTVPPGLVFSVGRATREG